MPFTETGRSPGRVGPEASSHGSYAARNSASSASGSWCSTHLSGWHRRRGPAVADNWPRSSSLRRFPQVSAMPRLYAEIVITAASAAASDGIRTGIGKFPIYLIKLLK
jgi:hypothetical protein